MSTKIIVFILKIVVIFTIGATIFGTLGIFSTSLHATCELQNDGTYTCQTRDTLLGFMFSKNQTDQVVGLEQRVKCSGSGSRKGCSYISEFVSTNGGKVQLSQLFTTSESQVTKLVSTINGLMKTKSTPITYTADPSPLLIFSLYLSIFLFIAAMLQAFLGLFQRNKENKPIIVRSDYPVSRRNAFIDFENETTSIRESGEEAFATILEVEDIGVAIQHENKEASAMRLKFNVTPNNGIPFESETYSMIANGSIKKFSVGKKVYVKFDKRNLEKVVLIRSAE